MTTAQLVATWQQLGKRVPRLWREHCEEQDARIEEFVLFSEHIARSVCLDQKVGDKCICFSCEANRLLAKAAK